VIGSISYSVGEVGLANLGLRVGNNVIADWIGHGPTVKFGSSLGAEIYGGEADGFAYVGRFASHIGGTPPEFPTEFPSFPPPPPAPVIPPVINNDPPIQPPPPVNPPVDPNEQPQDPGPLQPPIIEAPDPTPPPRNPDPNETQPGNEWTFGYPLIIDTWWNGAGYFGSEWPHYEIDRAFFIDWNPSDFLVADGTPSYLSEQNYLNFSADGNVLVSAPAALTHGTAVAGLMGASATRLSFTNAGAFASDVALLDSSPTPAPEPAAAILSAIALVGLTAITRCRGR
jgi:hypothetical protein